MQRIFDSARTAGQLTETYELSWSREQYDEACRKLERERAELRTEAERIFTVWMECVNLLNNGDVQSLSAKLEAEGLQSATGPRCEEYFIDAFATPFVRMMMQSEHLGHRLDRLDEE